MYVCICNALTESQVEEALSSGPTSVSEVYEVLGCKPQCGGCCKEIKSRLRRAEKVASGAD